MTLIHISVIHKLLVLLVAAIFSLSAVASDFSQTQTLAIQGDADAQYSLATMFDEGQGVSQDDAKAIEWYTKAANQEYAPAQFNLAIMYANGEGTCKNEAQAFNWYLKAANQNNAEAQFNLATLYVTGKGVRQNTVIAKEWFSKSCDNGYQRGCSVYQTLN